MVASWYSPRAGIGVACGFLVGASCFAQNTPPSAGSHTLPPDQVNRLTLSLEEIRQASSSVVEQQRREQMLRMYEEAQRRKAVLEKLKHEEPKPDPLTKFNLKDFADEKQKEMGSRALTYEEQKANRIELMMRRSYVPETDSSGSAEKPSAPAPRAPVVIPSTTTPPAEASPDSTLRDYTSVTTRKLQEAGATNSVIRPLSPTLSVSNRSFSIFNRATRSDEPVRGAASSGGTAFRPALGTSSAGSDSKKGASGSTTRPDPISPLDVVKSSTATPGPLDVVNESLSDNRYLNPATLYEPAALRTPDDKAADAKSAKAGDVRAVEIAKSTSPYASYFQTPSLFDSILLKPNPKLADGTQPVFAGDQPLADNRQKPPGNLTDTGKPALANNSAAQNDLASLLAPSPSGSGTLPASMGGVLQPSSPNATLAPGGLSFPNAGMYSPQNIGTLQPIAPITTLPRKGGIGPNGYYEPKSITDLQYGR